MIPTPWGMKMVQCLLTQPIPCHFFMLTAPPLPTPTIVPWRPVVPHIAPTPSYLFSRCTTPALVLCTVGPSLALSTVGLAPNPRADDYSPSLSSDTLPPSSGTYQHADQILLDHVITGITPLDMLVDGRPLLPVPSPPLIIFQSRSGAAHRFPGAGFAQHPTCARVSAGASPVWLS